MSRKHRHEWIYSVEFIRKPVVHRHCRKCVLVQVNKLTKGWATLVSPATQKRAKARLKAVTQPAESLFPPEP